MRGPQAVKVTANRTITWDGDYPQMGSPILIIPPTILAVAFIAFGAATLGICDGDVALVWFGFAALVIAGTAAMLAAFKIAGVVLVIGGLCLLVGLLSMPVGCTFAFQI